MRAPCRADLVPESSPTANQIVLRGRVLREGDRPVTDALIELWQAGTNGEYCGEPTDLAPDMDGEGFIGFGRAATDRRGRFEFRSVRPGQVPDVNGRLQAAHVNLHIFARGLMDRLATRIYLPDGLDLDQDPVLSTVDEARRKTLIAQRVETDAVPTYAIQLVLRGHEETVFFAL